MHYITLKNDRKRRRQARLLTFVVTTLTLVGVAYGVGALDQLAEAVQLYFAEPTAESAGPVAGLV
jgi:hypothetical protein